MRAGALPLAAGFKLFRSCEQVKSHRLREARAHTLALPSLLLRYRKCDFPAAQQDIIVKKPAFCGHFVPEFELLVTKRETFFETNGIFPGS
jgi:hypothetical protein